MSEQSTKIIDEHTGQQDRIWSMLRLAWEEIIYLKSQLAASSSEFVPGGRGRSTNSVGFRSALYL